MLFYSIWLDSGSRSRSGSGSGSGSNGPRMKWPKSAMLLPTDDHCSLLWSCRHCCRVPKPIVIIIKLDWFWIWAWLVITSWPYVTSDKLVRYIACSYVSNGASISFYHLHCSAVCVDLHEFNVRRLTMMIVWSRVKKHNGGVSDSEYPVEWLFPHQNNKFLPESWLSGQQNTFRWSVLVGVNPIFFFLWRNQPNPKHPLQTIGHFVKAIPQPRRLAIVFFRNFHSLAGGLMNFQYAISHNWLDTVASNLTECFRLPKTELIIPN